MDDKDLKRKAFLQLLTQTLSGPDKPAFKAAAYATMQAGRGQGLAFKGVGRVFIIAVLEDRQESGHSAPGTDSYQPAHASDDEVHGVSGQECPAHPDEQLVGQVRKDAPSLVHRE